MHGYQLLNELAELFGSRYRPSPGTVYPALEALESEGLIKADHSESRTIYSLTASGKEALEDRAYILTRLAQRIGVSLPGAGQLGPVLDEFTTRLSGLEGRVDVALIARKLNHLADEIESLVGARQKEHNVRSIRTSRHA